MIVRAGGDAGMFSGIIGGWSAGGPRGSLPVTKEVQVVTDLSSPPRKRGPRACPWLEQGAIALPWGPGFPLSRE